MPPERIGGIGCYVVAGRMDRHMLIMDADTPEEVAEIEAAMVRLGYEVEVKPVRIVYGLAGESA